MNEIREGMAVRHRSADLIMLAGRLRPDGTRLCSWDGEVPGEGLFFDYELVEVHCTMEYGGCCGR